MPCLPLTSFSTCHVYPLHLSNLLVVSSIFKFVQPCAASKDTFKLASVGKVTSHQSDGETSEVVISLLDRVVEASVSNKLQPRRVSSNEIQLSFGKITCFVTYPYPVDYDKTNIKFSRVEKKLTIRCPRLQQQFQDEKPLFAVDPHKLLAHFLSPDALVRLSGQQFLRADRVIQESCGDFSQAPPLISLKNSLMFFFQQQDMYYQLLLPKNNVHGINKRLYDYENRVPVVDLAFCFLEESFVHTVAPVWVKMSSGQSCNLKVSVTEYEMYSTTLPNEPLLLAVK